MDLSQYHSDTQNLRDTLLDFSIEYGEDFDRDVSKSFQTILKFLDTEQLFIEKQIANNLRRR